MSSFLKIPVLTAARYHLIGAGLFQKTNHINSKKYNSTQLASAFMYLLWGEYNKLLPDSDLSQETLQGAGTYMA